jgi:hypothetical protein
MKLDTRAGKFVSSTGLTAIDGQIRPGQPATTRQHPCRASSSLHAATGPPGAGEHEHQRLRDHQPTLLIKVGANHAGRHRQWLTATS